MQLTKQLCSWPTLKKENGKKKLVKNWILFFIFEDININNNPSECIY